MENQQDPNFLFFPASAQTLRGRAQSAAQRHSFVVVVFLGVVFLGSLIFLLTKTSLQGSEIDAPSSLTAGAPVVPLGVAQPDSASPGPFEGTATLSVASRPAGADVFIDGILIGTTPVEMHTVSAGVSYVTLRKEGYVSRDTIAIMRAATASGFALALEARPSPPPSSPEASSSEASSTPAVGRQSSAGGRSADHPSGGDPPPIDTVGAAAPTASPEIPDEAVSVSPPSQAERYEEHLARGNELFVQAHYLRARREYERALEAQPGDEKAAARVIKIDTLLAAARRAEELYNYHRGRGDVFFEREDFEAALADYRSALAHRPGDAPVRERLAAATEALEQRSSKAPAKDGIVFAVDEEPTLIGGLEGLHRQVRYPREAQRRGIEGRVIVSIVVDEEGRVQNPRILNGIGGGCDEEALRVIKKARFEPALRDGKPVKTQQALWVRFNLRESRTP